MQKGRACEFWAVVSDGSHPSCRNDFDWRRRASPEISTLTDTFTDYWSRPCRFGCVCVVAEILTMIVHMYYDECMEK